MKERPILFNSEMVRAILDDRKTQTRRMIKTDHYCIGERDDGTLWPWREDCNGGGDIWYSCPMGSVGDRLWVREAHAFVHEPAYRRSTGVFQKIIPDDHYAARVYRENFDRSRNFVWHPSIHMPQWTSRITLEITGVRVERLQDISEDDAEAEGAPRLCWDGTEFYADEVNGSHKCGFAGIWAHINGAESWDANPWVWVIEFKRLEQ